MTGPTPSEVELALWQLVPGGHAWTDDERGRMRMLLEAPTDEAALLRWSPPLADSPLEHVHVAAIRAVREAYAAGRARARRATRREAAW